MTKFVALYMAPAPVVAEMMKATPEQMKEGMAAWNSWGQKNQKAIVEMGAPLGKTKRVANGGVSDTRNEITGYSIVEADSLDAATKLFVGHPHLQMKGTAIDVLESMSMPGM